ncbi:MAG: shikimate dehydrogenase [Chromatiales bacterium]|jgi:shikimate dehydrogenase|nr:shikimate dehydrogenase [Chromatiales bacterium]
MSSLFDFDAPPDRYAVMGNPVSHSLSPRIHTEFARRARQRLEYTAIQVDEGGFAQAVGNFQGAGGKGLNITVPFKQPAFALAERLSERAERARAVNTLRFDAGTIYGDNTDGAGLVRDLCVNLGLNITGRRVLLLGAGGAARGAIAPLLDLHPATLVVANRHVDRARELRSDFARADALRAGGFDDLEGEAFDLLINATSASLHGEALKLPASLLASGAWCYDMMYAAEPTPFLKWAAVYGAAGTSDGLGMLVEQAAESFAWWRGVRPDTSGMVRSLREYLRDRGA